MPGLEERPRHEWMTAVTEQRLAGSPMTVAQQTLVLVFAMIIICGLFTLVALSRVNAMTEASESAARAWYRALLVKQYATLAADDAIFQNEVRSLIDEVRLLVADMSGHLQDDAIDVEAHLTRLDNIAEQNASHSRKVVDLPL